MPIKPPYPTCKQLMPSGKPCQCPAITDKPFCIHHSRERQRNRNLAKARQVKNFSNPKRADYRYLDDLNAEIFDNLHLPTLEDSAAIAIALTNVARLLGGGHLSIRAAEAMTNTIRIAEINIRKGNAFFNKDMPPATFDPDPVNHYGDAEGFVLPEEHILKDGHEELKRMAGADSANATRKSLGQMNHMFDPMEESAASSSKKGDSSAA